MGPRQTVHRSNADRRSSSLSRWRQIQGELEAWLANGRFAPGSKLPTEEELAQHFAVHRHTIRRAVQQLKQNELVRVEQGKGMFVCEPSLSYRIGRTTKLSSAARMLGRSLRYRLISVDQVRAIRFGTPLALPKGHPLIRIRMARVLDGRDIALMWCYFPLPRFNGIAQWIASTGSVSAAMKRYGVEEISRKSLRIRATNPTAQEAKVLGIERSTPMLELTHLAIDEKNIPIEFTVSTYDGRYFDILFDF
ncbi:phosphonate metabolism transcriptional regulator PhnF [Bradyrhizobium sp. CCBAU 53421]|uniref:phosphonate metabolism transcriptional regulator PhnF n=1 Tax=Bradyrhizobium sp. CCBAU 53421 TaxID=1325120 RepID=UPI00188AD1DE|nr:phosphonate metabolism transcriptional regulator PhnF [Bradyrhizobium sp. CCBAU 53421]QOZ33236.1 phosphonate metabolism transcriptional regulator PhnF [Bradyrhizobium sp. CCBAU 53421]